MSITFPMWFIYLWAVVIVLKFINAIISFPKTKKTLAEMPEKVAKLIAPKIVESLSDNLAGKVNASLNDKLSNEYIVVKKPVRKVKKEEAENA